MDLNNIELSEPTNPNDKVCAPNKVFEDGSCFTLNAVILMANAYNEENPDNKIVLNPKFETLHPHKYKKYLIKQMKNKMKKVCDNQKCWTQQGFMRHISRTNKEDIEKYTFRPDGPGGKFEWLNTLHIDEVMEQYEKKYPDFKFLGAVPMDFDELPVLGIKNLNFNQLLKEGKTKIGIIYNLDEHWKSGSHWVAGFADLKEGKIYYFDSYGSRPEKRVRAFMNRINRFCQSNGIKITDVDYNRKRHQFKNSECGVYSINFIVRLLKGKSFQEICDNPIPDEKINKCRMKYFTIDQDQKQT